ncbi:uncharacterized protein LOC129597444 [Paramacrobiotus metropolitanus]|uniref:uncharacterized protein LOC129597444 n=1 Tax=Paramacrobiotus metropolitanus TaxID=2943436 RepID=UPI0024463721|nr:uncharacterized protein LOC129597444 [Paramacrobiotus metropolitanus]
MKFQILGTMQMISILYQWTTVSSVVYPPSNQPYTAIHDGNFQADYILRVTSKIIATDCTTRLSTLVNGTLPGPALRFKEGQKVWIRVYNDMDEANLTIHWHGLTQRMAPFSDGTPMASQWPIPPYHHFDYEFQLQLGDAGTYFYHSHVGFQANTAYGALIVDEADGNPPYHYDDERTIAFQDVYYETDDRIEFNIQNPNNLIWPGNPKNVAVNGKSRAMNETYARPGPGCEMGVIDVAAGGVYRLRFIGATSYSQVFVAFEDHLNLVLIEVDGKYIMPHVVDHLEISSGQRYSVILFAKTQAELAGRNRFWMQFEIRSADSDDVRGYGILHYNTSAGPVDTFTLPAEKVLTLPNESYADGWLEDQLQPLKPDPSNPFIRLQEVTRRVYINVQAIDAKTMTGGDTEFYFQNGAPWYEKPEPFIPDVPKEPYLVSLYRNRTNYFPDYQRAVQGNGLDNVTKTFPAKVGEVLEIVWYLVGGSRFGDVYPHAWHAHGDHYYDCGTGLGTYDPVVNEAKLLARHGRIITRDTSNLYRPDPSTVAPEPGKVFTWRAMRVRVQNPGVWMIHCHLLLHMLMGMQTVWVFGELKDLTPLPAHLVEGYLTYGGSAYGNASYAPRVLHYWH